MKFPAFAAALAAAGMLSACAAVPAGKHDPRDPLERVNRDVFRFNTAADHAVFRPAAKAWKAVVPPPLRQGFGNFVGNLGYPVTIVNDVLQGKITDGGHDLTRLLVNSIFGLGFFDPATHAGLERHNEDFGQTLGKWGVPPGPYLMLPFVGPSSLRDAPSMVVDQYANGRHYLKDPYLDYGLWVTSKLQLRAELLATDAVLERAYDPYAFVRNAWLERREYQVRDGAVDESPADTGEDAPAN
ncbi:MAG: VacJ family lipoprotein [Gammaproteobacteria bacterium]|nr:VacJ family lipoprotein [Gammaproteobacteria bacterium]